MLEISVIVVNAWQVAVQRIAIAVNAGEPHEAPALSLMLREAVLEMPLQVDIQLGYQDPVSAYVLLFGDCHGPWLPLISSKIAAFYTDLFQSMFVF